ncbi:ATP synthase subunit I [Cytobacillus sp. FSL W7-1323]|uniref:ATP synthase subunit n=1 Tax=Cytobacillus kochii TaxID=859143 RepID=A0A248TIH8_9BACI|nr:MULTISPECIES: ATP synthase subunit I [Cytobacillus]ASV68018.1 ATP synthase subunit [Cytobacillus kochii]MCA1026353.1 ATP synthase subunit I [Cytobacillus kochii]MCM3322501.1 ATP synthase subunit I [Cytobacillus kochii]MCM3345021.1 ATP synthase subunit I [Cytobacillus kochii]MDM5209576.1 ATP synthase subunit I [Cytobacillus kochii]
MPEIQERFSRQRKYMLFLLSFFVLGWGFTSYQSIFLGLILGTVLSFFNLWLIVRKMIQFREAVEKEQKVRSLGTMSRMASAALAVIIALEYPAYFHLISVVLGLMTSYLVIMIDFFLQSFHLRKKREER